MRHAWGTIRERLGLRPSNASDPMENTNAGETADIGGMQGLAAEPTTSPSTDTRELMLAEMARAFNIGLGLNGLGASTAAGGEGDGEAVGRDVNGEESAEGDGSRGQSDSSPPMPPEGSFERFLVDLQIDLRAALTQVADNSAEDQPRDRELPELPHPHPASQSSQEQGAAPTVMPPDVESLPALSNDENTPPPPSAVAPLPARTNVLSSRHEDMHEVDDRESDTGSVPALQELSDSESEFDDGDDYDDDDGKSNPMCNPHVA